MNIPSFFIKRPVATSLLAIAIALSGLLAYFHMPVAPLPNVTLPVIVVQATMAGASPEIMASTVAEPLERRLATISGVTELTSINSVGSAMVVAQFAKRVVAAHPKRPVRRDEQRGEHGRHLRHRASHLHRRGLDPGDGRVAQCTGSVVSHGP